VRLTVRDVQEPFAIFLLQSAIGVAIYSLLLTPSENIETKTVVVNGSTTNTTTTFTKPPIIPEPYLIIIGLIILILLFPQIKSAKVGPIEFELSQFDLSQDTRENQPNLSMTDGKPL
jgi:hypothetical protein